jgi:hypothetical protein
MNFNLSNILTYFLTPWSRVLLKKLTGFEPVKKFPAFYGTRIFIKAVGGARHLSLIQLADGGTAFNTEGSCEYIE